MKLTFKLAFAALFAIPLHGFAQEYQSCHDLRDPGHLYAGFVASFPTLEARYLPYYNNMKFHSDVMTSVVFGFQGTPADNAKRNVFLRFEAAFSVLHCSGLGTEQGYPFGGDKKDYSFSAFIGTLGIGLHYAILGLPFGSSINFGGGIAFSCAGYSGNTVTVWQGSSKAYAIPNYAYFENSLTSFNLQFGLACGGRIELQAKRIFPFVLSEENNDGSMFYLSTCSIGILYHFKAWQPY